MSAPRPPSSTEKFLGFSPIHGVCRSRTWWGAVAGSQQERLTAAASASPCSIPPAVNLALSETAGPLLPWKRPWTVWFQLGHLVSLLFRWDFPCLSRRGLAPARCAHTTRSRSQPRACWGQRVQHRAAGLCAALPLRGFANPKPSHEHSGVSWSSYSLGFIFLMLYV